MLFRSREVDHWVKPVTAMLDQTPVLGDLPVGLDLRLLRALPVPASSKDSTGVVFAPQGPGKPVYLYAQDYA